MTRIDITLSSTTISILNDGQCIPIQLHKQHKVYIPELIFGHLLTSSNYEDSVNKVTGGRNGYGAKLTNIFSNLFEVEVADGENKKKLKIVWQNNMKEMG